MVMMSIKKRIVPTSTIHGIQRNYFDQYLFLGLLATDTELPCV